MRRCRFLAHLLVVALCFNGCFLTSLFDFGPKIDLAKNPWKIDSFMLGGTLYKPEGYDDVPNMRFDTAELKLYGNTGCNSFFASYVWVDEKKIEMRNSGITRRICQSENAMRFEQKLMEEFDGEFEVIEEGDEIRLRREELTINLSFLNETKD